MLTFVLGGARSGKSAYAEELGRRNVGSVTFIPTCPRIPDDVDLAGRIARHRAVRPADWGTIEEELDLAAAVAEAREGFLIIDCLTLWVGNLQHHDRSPDEIMAASQHALDAVRQRSSSTVVVSNEVGLGIVPADATSREYRDLLGLVNRQWAGAADRSLFLVAGRALPLHDPHDLT